MVCQQEPPIAYSSLPELQALSPEARRWLSYLLTAHGSLADLAAKTKTDLVTLVERFLAHDIQSALAAIERATAQLIRIRALISTPVALDTLTHVAALPTTNPLERRRAASALLRAVPALSGCHHSPRSGAVMTDEVQRTVKVSPQHANAPVVSHNPTPSHPIATSTNAADISSPNAQRSGTTGSRRTVAQVLAGAGQPHPSSQPFPESLNSEFRIPSSEWSPISDPRLEIRDPKAIHARDRPTIKAA